MKLTLLFGFLLSSIFGCFAQNQVRKDSIIASFAYNQSEVLNADALLQELDQIDLSSLTLIKLIGYTDSTGSLKRNKILAADRIKAVEKVLKNSRLSSVKIERVNANELSGSRVVPDELNRRVDILFFAKNDPPKPKSSLNFELNKPVNLNVNFKGGTAEFLATAYPNLELLKKAMLADTTLMLRLQGHVCCENDVDLSFKRAYAVAAYLNRNGIDHERMLSEGFSNKQPLVPDDSEANMAVNRRVEAIFYRRE